MNIKDYISIIINYHYTVEVNLWIIKGFVVGEKYLLGTKFLGLAFPNFKIAEMIV